MSSRLLELITHPEAPVRNQALELVVRELPLPALLAEIDALDRFWRQSDNLYLRVRALFFLSALCRYHLPERLPARPGKLSFTGFQHLLERRFTEAIHEFQKVKERDGWSDCLSSALAQAYYDLGLQNLANQVRRCVRSVRGNRWMYRAGHTRGQPLRIRRELLPVDGPSPIIHEKTPVRMDFSHSGWSDIFFLGMDYPEGARVLNLSVDLCVENDPHIREPRPPVEACFRVIDEPLVRLVSVDLQAIAEIHDLAELFHFGKDYLGLLKAALIASGLVPIGLEGSGQSLASLLETLAGPGRGLELVSCVNNIPKGSRLAVSTNLLAALIAVCMRATWQIRQLEGPLAEEERRIVASRAILGEWLGGSGGGWQDSGGIWPGIKIIQGCEAAEDDPEFGVSRGRLLPHHTILGEDVISGETRRKLQESLVLVHGGLAQNVGPILEMVTEKYLLRSAREWSARHQLRSLFDSILEALREGDIRRLGGLTTAQFYGPLQTIIPWATNDYTERLIERVRAHFQGDFWGFWMLGGMSGGGMGFIFDPSRTAEARGEVLRLMRALKEELQHSLPFAMEPVVYRFRINEEGSVATFRQGLEALLPGDYYPLLIPRWLRQDQRRLSETSRRDLELFGDAIHEQDNYRQAIHPLLHNLLPQRSGEKAARAAELPALLAMNGFDPQQHEAIRADLQSGRIGLAQNRLPPTAQIEDVRPEDVLDLSGDPRGSARSAGEEAIARGEVVVVSLAAGVGSRWTQGAGVVKALHPFHRLGGRHRSFLEVHLAKSRKAARLYGRAPFHVFTTSYLTHAPIEALLQARGHFGYGERLLLSGGRSIGLRLVPMERDLRFAWEEMPQQILDERAQKMRESVRAALLGWVKSKGEGSDYRDNLPHQCIHPVGHWYEIPNLLLNGTLAHILRERPQTRTLLIHNIDTLGACLDPVLLGCHRESGATITFEVIARRLQDHGGGLARVDGRLRLVEGLAMPREEDEFRLSYYNANTSWVEIDPLLAQFGLTRSDLPDPATIAGGVRRMAARLPTYVTLKDVKKRWGAGQEDIYPVTQFEKLWGDMTSLADSRCAYLAVDRQRGQQLKEQAQLDGWLRDGSAAHVETLCDWEESLP